MAARRRAWPEVVAGGLTSDTAVRLALENILRPLFNKLEGKKAAGRVIRRCELGEEACGFAMSVPVAPVADFFRRRCYRRRRRLRGAVKTAAEALRDRSHFVDLKGPPGRVVVLVGDVVF